MEYGFTRVCACVPELRVADVGFNASAIEAASREAARNGAQVILFPELSLTGYTCADLFLQDILVERAGEALVRLAVDTASLGSAIVVGLPVRRFGRLYNCAAVIQGGSIRGVVPKTYIPNYKEYYEARWFAPGNEGRPGTVEIAGWGDIPFGTDLLFRAKPGTGGADESRESGLRFPRSFVFGIEICEDIWVPVPPSSRQALAGAVLLLNLSASVELVGKAGYRRELAVQQSARCVAAYVYASSGVHESTTDVVFSGHALVAEYGSVLAESKRFSRTLELTYADVDIARLENERPRQGSFGHGEAALPESAWREISVGIPEWRLESFARRVDPRPFVPGSLGERNDRCAEIFAIQTAGLAKRIEHTGVKSVIVGISGGLDSTLALLVAVRTLDLLKRPRSEVVAVTMPGFGTTDGTYGNALELMKSLGATIRDIDIKKACLLHFADIGHDPAVHDVTYENVQARERTQILMDIANASGGLVIGTGDLSEMALGWSTYNGDHMSMYAVNCSVPKTLVRYLVEWVADNVADRASGDVLRRIVDTPISPELLPPAENGEIRQKTEDIVGPYDLHDFFLYYHIRFGSGPEKLLFLAERAFAGRFDRVTIVKWLGVFYRRFFAQQFKRSCTPDGPKVGSVSLSPRGDWRMPSDASAAEWIARLEACSSERSSRP